MILRWWPPVALAAMALLGLVVGQASTGFDDWFLQFSHSPTRTLLFFSQPALLAVLMMGAAAVAFDARRERLALLVLLAPAVGWGLVQLLKRLFGRLKDGTYAYPSGHITLTVIVWGTVVVVAGAALWSVYAAIASIALAMIGMGTTHHFFTDTIGGLLLGSAIVCAVALVGRPRLTRVNPVRSTSQEMATIRP